MPVSVALLSKSPKTVTAVKSPNFGMAADMVDYRVFLMLLQIANVAGINYMRSIRFLG